MSCDKPEEKTFSLFYFFINKVRARIDIFSTIFRRGTRRGRAHFCVCNSCLSLKIIYGKVPSLALRPKTGIRPAVCVNSVGQSAWM